MVELAFGRFLTIFSVAELSHLFFCHHEVWPNRLFPSLLALFSADVLLHHHYLGETFLRAFSSACTDSILWIAILFASIGTYRLFFHRLTKFPGPTAWALSKWSFFTTDLEGNRPFVVHAAHEKYGDVVRTGPREVSINAPTAIAPISSAKSDFHKGPWYDGAAGTKRGKARSLHTTVDKADHMQRRKIWDTAFNAKALRGYESILLRNAETMVAQLESRAKNKEKVDIDDWCMLYGFDVMSEVGFGKNWGLLEDGKLNETFEALEGFMKFVLVVANLPYITEVLGRLPTPADVFAKHVGQALEERKKNAGNNKDIISYLSNEDGKEGVRESTETEMLADANLIVVAGSDTSSTSMGIAFFLLLKYPRVMQKLREEIQQVFGATPVSDFNLLDKSCPYLNAVINECLRLFPPVASGLQKTNEKEPLVVNVHGSQIVVPADTIITIPTWTMHRDPRNFSPDPNEFRPERWLDPENEKALDRTAFNPFSFGRTSCIGKSLAYMEIRLVLARLIQRFDIEPHPSFDAEAFKRGIRDMFVTRRMVKLPVLLSVREGSS